MPSNAEWKKSLKKRKNNEASNVEIIFIQLLRLSMRCGNVVSFENLTTVVRRQSSYRWRYLIPLLVAMDGLGERTLLSSWCERVKRENFSKTELRNVADSHQPWLKRWMK